MVAKCLCLCAFIQHPSPAPVPSSDSTANGSQTLLSVCPLPNRAPSHFLYGLQWKAHAFSGTERRNLWYLPKLSHLAHSSFVRYSFQWHSGSSCFWFIQSFQRAKWVTLDHQEWGPYPEKPQWWLSLNLGIMAYWLPVTTINKWG